VIAFLKAERSKGRLLYLASASDRRYVERVAHHLALFDGVFGSDAAVNLAVSADRLCIGGVLAASILPMRLLLSSLLL